MLTMVGVGRCGGRGSRVTKGIGGVSLSSMVRFLEWSARGGGGSWGGKWTQRKATVFAVPFTVMRWEGSR
jgi:hypothetical protein